VLLRAVHETKRIKKQIKKRDKNIPDQRHHLHRVKSPERPKKKHKRTWGFQDVDERAARTASKIFMALKSPDRDYLDFQTDVWPLFQILACVSNTTGDTQRASGSQPDLTKRNQEQQERINRALHVVFDKCDKGRVTLLALTEVIQRMFRERKRLVSSLSGTSRNVRPKMTPGMRSVISKLNDFLTALLSLFLGISTLSIFGVNAVATLLSVASVLVSFAFLFGASARNVFEAIIFLFFIHVRPSRLFSRSNYTLAVRCWRSDRGSISKLYRHENQSPLDASGTLGRA
jgi:hypothetical protein